MLDRRRFLGRLGLLTAGTALGSLLAANAAEAKPGASWTITVIGYPGGPNRGGDGWDGKVYHFADPKFIGKHYTLDGEGNIQLTR